MNGPYCLIQRKTIKLGRSFSVKTVLDAFSSPLSYFVFCDYYGKLIHHQKWVCPKIHILPAIPENYLSTLFITISQSLQHIAACMEHFQVFNFILLLKPMIVEFEATTSPCVLHSSDWVQQLHDLTQLEQWPSHRRPNEVEQQ